MILMLDILLIIIAYIIYIAGALYAVKVFSSDAEDVLDCIFVGFLSTLWFISLPIYCYELITEID